MEVHRSISRSDSSRLMQRMLAGLAAGSILLAPGSAICASAPQSRLDARIVMLGTAGGAETRLKRVQSTTAIVVNGAIYLLDVGDSAIRQMARAGLKRDKVRAIFLTLFSQDRISGLPPFLSTRWLMQKPAPLAIFAPQGLDQTLAGINLSLQAVATSSFVPSAEPLAQVSAHELVESGPVYQDENIKVTALALPRVAGEPPVAFAYRFETPGGSIVFTGATGARDSLAGFAQGTDVLISEVYDIDGITKQIGSAQATPEMLARVFKHMNSNHLNPEQIGELAAASNAGRVVLHRLEPGSDSETAGYAERAYAAGVRGKYHGPVLVPNDLQVVEITASTKK